MLLDLDFITPYYRSRDLLPELQQAGVEVVAPEGDLSRSDLPVVTARAVQALSSYDGPVVADIGGDEGARVVGSLRVRLTPGGYEAWMVVNPFRPGTGSPEQVAAYARWLESIARIQFTGLVSNPNLGPLTRPVQVVEGLEQVKEAARILGLPVTLTAVHQALLPALSELIPEQRLLPLQPKMRPPWEQDLA